MFLRSWIASVGGASPAVSFQYEQTRALINYLMGYHNVFCPLMGFEVFLLP